MAKETEKGILKRALRNTSLMARFIGDAYENGNGNRAAAALALLDEVHKDVHGVLDPLLEAAAVKAATSNGSAEEPAEEAATQ